MDGEGGAVLEDGAHLHRRPHVADAVVVEVEVVVDGADTHQGVVVGMEVVEETGSRHLLGGQATALLASNLEDGDVPAGLGQVGGQGHAVVAGADDHGIVGGIRHLCSPSYWPETMVAPPCLGKRRGPATGRVSASLCWKHHRKKAFQLEETRHRALRSFYQDHVFATD